ncbi:hypothetical protein LSH36_1064g00016 [Paralvinella palmiformis]|uniref:Uncharacterized protein n=1 Tax=Paralvinella palmiformis TaxID=53620 RepID=A0AAD9IVF0_9ANNE|nr:hypothetical protein LSH36_1064g00016 [Paralvinella palmiformis]
MLRKLRRILKPPFLLVIVLIVLGLYIIVALLELEYVSRNKNLHDNHIPIDDDADISRHPNYNINAFSINKSLLNIIDIREYFPLNESTVNQFVFVTAASDNYLPVVEKSIATVQEFFSGRKIIFFDLNQEESENPVNALCNVEYRKFPFSKYPNFVSNLHAYAWKPLIIVEVLQEYPGLMWFDSSVRFLSNDTRHIFAKVISTDGVLLFNYAGHNTFSVTHPNMFKYLSSDMQRLQETLQYEANIMMFYRTKSISDDILKWWFMCALVEDCFAPTKSYLCKHGFQNSPTKYAGCHRFDQSAINILLANKFNYNYTIYAKHFDNFEEIRRNNIKGYSPRRC